MAWTREQILAVKDLPLREVKVQAWGPAASVWLRTMSAGERDRYFLQSRKGDSMELDPENFRARLLAYCLCDPNGKRLFKDDEVDLIGAKCGEAVNFLYAQAQDLNAFDKTETEKVEDARKNS
jgi:hypothetical protein